MDINFFGASFRDVFGFTLPGNGGTSKRQDYSPSIRQSRNISDLHNSRSLSFVAPDPQDGAMTYQYGAGGQIAAASFDDLYQTENQLITHYRHMSLFPECDSGIDDVINAMLVSEEDKPIVTLRLENLKVSSGLRDKIRDEFYYIQRLLNFKYFYYELARRSYIDGRMYHHIMIDKENPKAGITELRYVDPRQIRKVRGVEKIIDARTGLPVVADVKEFYLYNPMGVLAPTAMQGIPIAVDSISFVNSGILNKDSTMILSHLHKAIKPLNQLKIMEDACVIYRMTRAPERRVFYVDVGNLPTNRAEAYVKDLMNRFKNRLVYNANTGEVGDDRRYLAMQEDFWLPRREGGKGTEVDTLQGGENLGKMDDVDYYLRQLYKSLNVPISRLDPNSGFNLGRSAEITRDEIKFTKFIFRLRSKFSEVFNNPLRVQLILKGLASEAGWKDIKEQISYDYLSDSYFAELKDAEIMRERIDIAEKADGFVGRYFSRTEVRKKILRQSDEDIMRNEKEIREEGVSGMFSVRSGKVVSDTGKPKNTKSDDTEDSEENIDDKFPGNASQDDDSTKYSHDDSLSDEGKVSSKKTRSVKKKPTNITRRVRVGKLELASVN